MPFPPLAARVLLTSATAILMRACTRRCSSAWDKTDMKVALAETVVPRSSLMNDVRVALGSDPVCTRWSASTRTSTGVGEASCELATINSSSCAALLPHWTTVTSRGNRLPVPLSRSTISCLVTFASAGGLLSNLRSPGRSAMRTLSDWNWEKDSHEDQLTSTMARP
eukprot:6191536-Amphidinium_carterae.1